MNLKDITMIITIMQKRSIQQKGTLLLFRLGLFDDILIFDTYKEQLAYTEAHQKFDEFGLCVIYNSIELSDMIIKEEIPNSLLFDITENDIEIIIRELTKGELK